MTKQMEQHLQLLANAFFENLNIDECEFGGIGLDSKRPFGNSQVELDILEIIGEEPDTDDGYSEQQMQYARDLYYYELIPYLQKSWKKFKK